MWNWHENHQPQGTQISTVTKAPFVQKSNRMVFSVDRNRKFSDCIFSTTAIFRLTGLLWWQKLTWLSFPACSSRIVNFAIQFCFFCKSTPREAIPVIVSMFQSSLTVVWFSWTNHNSLLRIATNEIASFCIDNRLREIVFFLFVKGKRPAFE